MEQANVSSSVVDDTVGRAINLIYHDAKEGAHFFNLSEIGFKVSEEAVEFLKSLKEKVGVIAVAGKYRTGKSFMLNRVILNEINTGFGVGPTINPCTKV